MLLNRIGKLSQPSSVLFLCDLQEKFRHNIAFFPQIVSVAARMLQAAKILEVPIIITEQYPKGLGPTVPELGADGLIKYSKTCFSMLTSDVQDKLQSIGERQSVILCGIETQACIMQMALGRLDAKGSNAQTGAGQKCGGDSSRDPIGRWGNLQNLTRKLTKRQALYLNNQEGRGQTKPYIRYCSVMARWHSSGLKRSKIS
ncbi:isochorismatase domain-containing 2 isoform X2 [Pelobates cultripes]|uniref:Isochorismatase domain-containing 2 isoform X2 n=2 Tax=Pelobates cultripes TaxID=61616 RepID=A0AAD1WLR7_PELCU|nr:isochorismatase domain-containing 2 isoform X2 [Pelobates cultripes]